MRSMPLSLLLALVAPLTHGGLSARQEIASQALEAAAHGQVPARLFNVTRVVDGDTIHIVRNGRTDKLRLLSVDTEEKITGRGGISPTKPETVYGQECAEWAVEFFAELADGDNPAQVGLRFPKGVEARDVYGRLLCHVILHDGRDFNLLLVEEGKSPYFNKYGNSRICHDEFVAAQAAARKAQLGVWHPDANRARTEGAPEARRPYDRLLPWWQARAEAVESFRGDAESAPQPVVAADEPVALREVMELCMDDPEVRVSVFAEIDRFFDESDGSLTVLLRTGDKKSAVRVTLPGDARGDIEAFLRERKEEFRQNYVRVDGRLTPGPRGYRLENAANWRLAGPAVAR